MESLAFIHHAVAYADPTPEPELRSFDLSDWRIPSSAWMGLVGAITLFSILSAVTPAEAMVYRKGNTGPAVEQIQRSLGIPVDGIYGPVTERAVLNYQNRFGLLVDGKAGPETLNSLGLNPLIDTVGVAPASSGRLAPNGQAFISTRSGVGVNLRGAPNGSITGGLADGTTVSLTGREVAAGGYVWVELTDGQWVASDFLAYNRPAVATSASFAPARSGRMTPQSGTAVVSTPTGVGVNLRRTPNGEVVASLPERATVFLTGAEVAAGNYIWAETTDGAWVATNFLIGDVGQGIAAAPTAPATSTAADPFTNESFTDDPVATDDPAAGDESEAIATNPNTTNSNTTAPETDDTTAEDPAAETETADGETPDTETADETTAEDTTETADAADETGTDTNVGLTFPADDEETADTADESPATNETDETATDETTPDTADAADTEEDTAAEDTTTEDIAADAGDADAGENVGSEVGDDVTETADAPADEADPDTAADATEGTADDTDDSDVGNGADEAVATDSQPDAADATDPADDDAIAEETGEELPVEASDDFQGPQGTFTVKAPTELRSEPGGNTLTTLMPGETIDLTERRRLDNDTVWAQAADGTWIDAMNVDLDNSQAEQSPAPTADDTDTATEPPDDTTTSTAEDTDTADDPAAADDFEGPSGTFTTEASVDRFDQPNGAIAGSIQAGNEFNVTSRRRLVGSTVWAQLDDGSWVEARQIDTAIATANAGNPDPQPEPQAEAPEADEPEATTDSPEEDADDAAGTDDDGQETAGDEAVELQIADAYVFMGPSGEFVAAATIEKREDPYGLVIGSVSAGDEVELTGKRTFALNRTWAELSDGTWVDIRNLQAR